MESDSKKKYPVKRMNISINMEKTGENIKRSIKESKYTIHDIMTITGITTEQTIYKWYRGQSIPSLETQFILCKLLGLKITELLVLDGEFDFSGDTDVSDKALEYKEIPYVDLQKMKTDRICRLQHYWRLLCEAA